MRYRYRTTRLPTDLAIEPTMKKNLQRVDDIDSLIDEGRACGDFIAQNCQFALAFNDLEESQRAII